MKQGSTEGHSAKSAYPKRLALIVASLVGLTVFLVLTSLFMVSQPIGSTLSGYFYGVSRSENFGSVSVPPDGGMVKDLTKLNLTEGDRTLVPPLENGGSASETVSTPDVNVVEISKNPHSTPQGTNEKLVSQPEVSVTVSENPAVSKSEETVDQPAGKLGSLNEGEFHNTSLPTNVTNSVQTGKDPTPSTDVLSSVSPQEDNISSKVGSGYSGILKSRLYFLSFIIASLYPKNAFLALIPNSNVQFYLNYFMFFLLLNITCAEYLLAIFPIS